MNLLDYYPPHSVTDQAHCEAIKQSLSESGWTGSPLVSDGYFLITGSHRYEAARQLIQNGELDRNEPEIIDIRDLFGAEALDFDALMTENSDDLVYVLSHLPAAVREEYGIDRQ